MSKNTRDALKNSPLPDDDLSGGEQDLLRQMLDRQLEKKLENALAEQGIRRNPPAAPFRKWLPWLILIAVLLGAFAAYHYATRPPAPREMAIAALKEPLALDTGVRGDDSTADATRERILPEYQRGDYRRALDQLQPLLPANRFDDHFLAGLCQLYLGQYREAAESLEKASAIDSITYSDELQWRLALAWTLAGERAQAIPVLKRVASSDSSRDRVAAQRLLEALSAQ